MTMTEPGAVERHVCRWDDGGWTIQHPLACRLASLFDCPSNAIARHQAVSGPPPEGYGWYFLDDTEEGWRWERMDRAPEEPDPGQEARRLACSLASVRIEDSDDYEGLADIAATCEDVARRCRDQRDALLRTGP
jgi:hypothetical protein